MLDKLATAPWLARLTQEEKEIYASMREVESNWLEACEEAGCEVFQDDGRQAVVLVPPAVVPPDVSVDVYAEWRAAALDAAKREGKSPTIGKRSGQPPRWITPHGLADARHAEDAIWVTARATAAARGARITPDEALEYLLGRLQRSARAHENSLKAGQRARADGQGAALDELRAAVDRAKAVIELARANGLRIGAQVASGHGRIVAVRWPGEIRAVTTTWPTVSMLGVAPGVSVELARPRGPRAGSGEVIVCGPIRFRVTGGAAG